MHLAILIIAVILVGGGIFLRNKITVESPPEEEVVLGQSDPTATPTSSPTQPITQTSTPRPSPSQPSPTNNVHTFVYPNATITSQSPDSLSLQSTDDAQTITDWYKNKIKELGMSTRSFVQTKTNDNVHNVLAAAKNNEEIKVTITKNAGERFVSIVVGR